ncbi:MAG: hypothetical protein KY464_00190 [Gemmatimonadetes bacterium]|nr:hypothetical protein [Gemmatimonadota bacterium]
MRYFRSTPTAPPGLPRCRRAAVRLLPLLLGLLLPLAPACAQGRGEAAAVQADTAFATQVARLSEPGGFFDTDNLISNEGSYLHVMDELDARGVRGGAYIGVGPDQNFSYIARIRPAIAILVDIRRDNLLEHLLFKSLFELSRDRLEYLALLTGRPVPATRDPAEPIDSIVEYLDRTPLLRSAFEDSHARVVQRIRGYGVPIDSGEWRTLRRFHSAFAEQGLGLRFESFGRAPQPHYPSLRQLILERDMGGRQASYLASDHSFQFVRSLQLRNGVIPAVGDLAGAGALPAIASFLRARGERVSAYYISNVDYYVVRDGKLDPFLANVKRLPLDERSVIIRSVFRGPASVPIAQTSSPWRSAQLLQSLPTLVGEYDSGRVRRYYDLVATGSSRPR